MEKGSQEKNLGTLTYNHSLFVAYLANVAVGYEWISDTKFHKFSDKDWI